MRFYLNISRCVCNLMITMISIFATLPECPAQTNDPRLFTVSSDRFLLVWQQDQNRDLFLAQFLKQDGVPDGTVFNIKSNELIAFNASSEFMVTKTFQFPGNEYFNESFSVFAWMYNAVPDTTGHVILINREWPFCGTGLLGFEEFLFSADQKYIYLYQFDGQMGCTICDNSGSKISDFQRPEAGMHITGDGLPDGSFAAAWFGGNTYYGDSSTVPGIYIASTGTDNAVCVKEYNRFPENLREMDPDIVPWLKMRSQDDATYTLFIFEPDSMALGGLVPDRQSGIVNESWISVPRLFQTSNGSFPRLKIFNVSETGGDTISIFISVDIYENSVRHTANYLCYFSDKNFSPPEAVTNTTRNFGTDCFKFKVGTHDFINPVRYNNEIRIDYFHDFTLQDSKTIAVVSSLGDDQQVAASANLYLSQNYPNPLKSKTTFTISVPYQGKVSISIFDSRGRLIKTLFEKWMNAGSYPVRVDLNDQPSGIYFLRLQNNQLTAVRRIILLK